MPSAGGIFVDFLEGLQASDGYRERERAREREQFRGEIILTISLSSPRRRNVAGRMRAL